MSIIDRLERRMGWAAFPGLIRYLAMFQLLTIVLAWLNPTIIEKLMFHYPSIMGGEVWRIFSFILLPKPELAAGPGGWTAIVAFFMAYLLMMFGDGLEREWGTFRTSMYAYCGVAAAIISSMVFGALNPNAYIFPALYFNLSIMFAFAVYYPSFELMLMFIIPVKIYLLAILAGVLLLLSCLSTPPLFLLIVGSLAHFFLFIGPSGIRSALQKSANAKRQHDFKKKSLPNDEAFHNCESCGATEHTHPDRQFRVGVDDRELCDSCLPEPESK